MRAPRIVVVGDLMLDRSESGTATRLSPEAPVVVLKNPVRTQALGGAGNAAANVRSLGGEAVLVGALGDDSAGVTCRALIADLGAADGTVLTPTMKTTVKTRFLVGAHQIMRLDVESAELSEAMIDQLIERCERELDDAAVIVLSDYDKGIVTARLARAVIATARRRNVPVVVDSKKTDIACFAGCTLIAPNHHEAEAMTGQTDPVRAASIIAGITGSAVLITLGAKGMLLTVGGREIHVPSHAESVSDVTGAGDTVTAALAVAIAEGATLESAARWANTAAALAVSHAGTFAVPRELMGRIIG